MLLLLLYERLYFFCIFSKNVANRLLNLHDAIQIAEDEGLQNPTIYIQPPTNASDNVSDEDSGDEDVNVENLTVHQLVAEAEIAGDSHSDSDFGNDNSPPLKPKKKQRVKWCESSAAMNNKFTDWSPLQAPHAHDRNLSPHEFFELFFDDEMILMIVDYSNRYAFQNNHTLNLSANDLRCFIAILIISGYVPLPRWRQFWDAKLDTHNDMVSKAMRRDRFEEIKRFIHFSNNDSLDANDKFLKVRPLWTV
jgi:DNA excision repair protein ERCC-6